LHPETFLEETWWLSDHAQNNIENEAPENNKYFCGASSLLALCMVTQPEYWKWAIIVTELSYIIQNLILYFTQINAFVPKKTEQEQISDLLNQVTDECRLDDALHNKGENSTKVIIL